MEESSCGRARIGPDRAEAFTDLLREGVYTYSYNARATTRGEFVAPSAKAEEMYHPETFGRSASDRVIVEQGASGAHFGMVSDICGEMASMQMTGTRAEVVDWLEDLVGKHAVADKTLAWNNIFCVALLGGDPERSCLDGLARAEPDGQGSLGVFGGAGCFGLAR